MSSPTLSDLANESLPRLPLKPLKNMGRWIVDDDGKVYIFRGVNMVNKLPPYTLSSTGFDEDDADLLAENGINVVRVGVIYSAVEPAPNVYDANYLKDIHKTVTMLAERGVMSLIEFHQDGWGPSFNCEGFPEWATITTPHDIRPIGNFPEIYFLNAAVQTAFDNFWKNSPGPDGKGLQNHYALAWRFAASTLKDAPGILGWEIMNEPFPGSKWRESGTPAMGKILTDFTQNLIYEIRKADTQHMIWYEPWVFFDIGQPINLATFKDPGPVRRLGMSFHNYEKIDKYPTVWQNALNRADSTGDALLATEFGATTVASDITAEMNSADQYMMSVFYWAYSNRTPYQIADATGKPVSSITQGLVYDPRLALEAPNLYVDKFNALVRPYPMSVAGIPTSWNFDPVSLTFTLSYSQAKIGGITEIFVPKRQYPEGFVVELTGGIHVTAEQRVFVEARASNVSVTVKPAP